MGVPPGIPVHIGGLEDSWRAQPGTSAYCTELPPAALQEALGRADGEDAPLRRDLCMRAFGTFGTPVGPRKHLVRPHRAITLTPDPPETASGRPCEGVS